VEHTFLFETLLLFNSKPCYYKIYKAGDLLYGEPVPHHYYNSTSFPYFLVKMQENQWQIEGIHDQGMMEQITRELEKHL
jgi:hypothetical protein